jgi:uncharacterized protein
MRILILLAFLFIAAPAMAEDAALPPEFAATKLKAEQGHVESQLLMGHFYQFAAGPDVDNREAAKWYLKAAERGNFIAQLSLAQMYRFGEGVTQNYEEAYFWFLLASVDGSEAAIQLRDMAERKLTPAQALAVQKRAAEWKPMLENKE